MHFTSANAVEEVVYAMRLADWPRARNRALINSLADGSPPYTAEQENSLGIVVNVNDLSMTRLAHDARQQLYSAFNKPGNFFTCRTDFGPIHRRQERGMIVTKEVNRIMKRSLEYWECMRSKLALTILHGIGPSAWDNEYSWCADPLGVEDVLVPSNTKLTFKNLPFFAIFRSYTAEELYRLTHGPKVDPGWNMDAVDASIKWAVEQTASLQGTRWSEYWMPEKLQERIKEDSGLFASDIVQTIDCYDFYFRNDHEDTDESGWCRRIIFDAYGGYNYWSGKEKPSMPDKNLLGRKGDFLYNPGDRVFASKLGEIIHWQFADLSATAPFRYHTVRSLGFMLYAVCHLQNRLRCKFSEAVFENLMMYMRIKSADDLERALKIELANRGIIDESVSFLSPSERWQINAQLAELGLSEFKQIIQDNSSGFVQNQNFSRDRVEKTKFQVMAEVNAMTTLVSAGLQQAYKYQNFEYQEIFRRFCIPNSRDPNVREFRVRCMKRGVPEKSLVAEAWDLEPERIMGSGNKTLEMAIAQQLMDWRPAYGPEGQQEILRQATLSITDDAALTSVLVPKTEVVSDSKHDAMLAFGSLMAGAIVQFKPDQNRTEVVEVLLGELALKVDQINKIGRGMATPSELVGLQNAVQHVSQLIELIAQDQNQRERARQFGDALGEISNQIKAFAQRLAEQQKKEAEDGGLDPKDAAKIQATIIGAQVKAQNTERAHGQRTAQRQVAFELEQQREEARLAADLRKKALETQIDVEAKDLTTASEINRERVKSREQPTPTE